MLRVGNKLNEMANLKFALYYSLDSWRWFTAIYASFTFWRLASPKVKRFTEEKINVGKFTCERP